MSSYNLNSNYGQAYAGAMMAGQSSGKTFIVAPSGLAGQDLLTELLPVDEQGQNRVFETITAALGSAVSGRGDTILVAPGAYDETVAVSKANVTIRGLGGRGAAFIEPSTAGAEGMQVTADDVTVINLGIACDDTGDYALNLNSATRFRAVGCKIEGADTTGSLVLVDGTATDQTADARFLDCEFCYAAKCFTFDDSLYGYPTQIFVDKCLFRDITTNMFGIASGGLVKGLYVTDCVFGNTEANVAPTDYILLSSNSNTGFFANNFFATATNATGVLTIGTGIMWGPNGTEAGWSTARPA